MLRRALVLPLSLALLALGRSLAAACACGCGIFDVQTGAVLPTHGGGTAFFEYDHMDQRRNWSGARQAPAEDNEDQRLKTGFFTVGTHFMASKDWGGMIDLPYWTRDFTVLSDEDGSREQFKHSAVGDVRLRAVYAGFSPDMTSGLTFGAKLPTGPIHQTGMDRDTQIGTGSTDLLLGAYTLGAIGERFGWYADGLYDQPVLIAGHYRPGAELDAVAGAYYNDWSVGGLKLAPLAQLVVSQRWSDQGEASDSPNSGYRRLVLGPGAELVYGRVSLYGSVGFPVWQYVKGNQLVAPVFLKTVLGWAF
jgi:hypothetical protein